MHNFIARLVGNCYEPARQLLNTGDSISMNKLKSCVLVALLLSLPSIASAELLCAKKKVKVVGGKIALANSLLTTDEEECPAKYQVVKDLNTIRDQQLAAFAYVDASGTAVSYGGSSVTAVSVVPNLVGTASFVITFTGTFEGFDETDTPDNRNRLTINSTGVSFDYGVSNAYVVSATSTEVKVEVYIWKSNDLVTIDPQAGIYVSVLKGELSPS